MSGIASEEELRLAGDAAQAGNDARRDLEQSRFLSPRSGAEEHSEAISGFGLKETNGWVPGSFGQWQSEFKPLLRSTARWEGFCYIVKDLLERPAPVIVETGTLRQPGNWRGDGQSTRLWQWVVDHKPGCAVSVDIESSACDLARRECPKVHTVCADSPSFLRGFFPFAIDLLYLDSKEWGPGAEVESAMHQVAELSAIWDRLPSGCLIASDDSHSKDQGKPALTRRLLHMLSIEPVLDTYIVVWRKP